MTARDLAFLISFSTQARDAKPERLIEAELLVRDGIGYTITERGEAHVRALLAVPLPSAVTVPNGDEWSQRE